MSFIFSNDSKTIFWRAFTISGQPAGLGADCPVCGSRVRYGLYAGDTFEHCGKRERVPTDWSDLPCRSLKRGMPELPKGHLLLDTWDGSAGMSWDEESAAKSDDPGAFEVTWI